jgi:uncharacterized membrane protein
MAVVLRQSLALDLRICCLIVLIAGVPLVRMMAEYPVNALVIVVVIFLFGWPWWRRGEICSWSGDWQ